MLKNIYLFNFTQYNTKTYTHHVIDKEEVMEIKRQYGLNPNNNFELNDARTYFNPRNDLFRTNYNWFITKQPDYLDVITIKYRPNVDNYKYAKNNTFNLNTFLTNEQDIEEVHLFYYYQELADIEKQVDKYIQDIEN
ncbi:hypothetical protein ['Camptotheca acuminata' phytoplasma]|uniref:hypothetical protein n=1 Tax='Camptotheca acuminata' phytoplasma TaxID=3239192 RepID=UPI003519F9F7